MLREIAYVFLGVVVVAYAVEFAVGLADDPREPPRARTRVPLIGHLLGMVREGKQYHTTLSRQLSDSRGGSPDMYTMGILGIFKMYVCNAPDLVPAIQRNAKTLSFRPLVQLSMKKLSDVGDQTYTLGGSGEMTEKLEHAQKAALAPGPHLDAQTMRTAARMVEEMRRLEADVRAGGGRVSALPLLAFVRNVIVQASADGIYGSTHPWGDSKVVDAFWTWHAFLPKMMIMPRLLARRGFASRQVVFDAYARYLGVRGGGGGGGDGGDGSQGAVVVPADAAQVIHERQRVYAEAGVCVADRVKLEAAWPLAVFSNTVPTAYWLLWEVYARPALLASVREEVETTAVREVEDPAGDTGDTGDTDGFGRRRRGRRRHHRLDLSALKRCRLLLAALEETQRMRHAHASVRRVLETTVLLDGRYLLKKGCLVQMPGGPIHHSRAVYGPRADAFDPHRFRGASGQGPSGGGGAACEGEGVPKGKHFLAWGVPPQLCPARQFAATETLLLAALVFLRFDMEPVDAAGRPIPWNPNPALQTGEIATLMAPREDVALRVTLREDWVGTWAVTLDEAKSRIPLTSG